jgi:hypothetical protein
MYQAPTDTGKSSQSAPAMTTFIMFPVENKFDNIPDPEWENTFSDWAASTMLDLHGVINDSPSLNDEQNLQVDGFNHVFQW